MTWRGPGQTSDQQDLAAMLDGFARGRTGILTDDAGAVSTLVEALAELGVWTLGTSALSGGGGADRATTAVALERLGRFWPALGWASAQAHAAVDVLSGTDGFGELVAAVHAGRAAVAVVEDDADQVRLSWSDDGSLVGAVDRVDVAHESPYLMVLDSAGDALLVAPDQYEATAVRRTGLAGALTRSLVLNVPGDRVVRVPGADATAARLRLRYGAAAVAAGICGAAADGALAYVAERNQFGAALTALPSVRHAVLRQADAVVVALSAAVAGPDDPQGSLAAARSACDLAVEVAAKALQSHGGYGYLNEYPAERFLRDALSLRAAVGADGLARTAGLSLVGTPRPQMLSAQARAASS